MANNRELTQLAAFVAVDDATRKIGIATTATPYVGIGTADPQYKLDVNGDINFNGSLYQNGSQFVASRWTVGIGSSIYRLSNIGIGTTNPSSKLSVIGDISASGIVTATSFSGSGESLTGIVTSITAGSGISIDQSTGAVTITSTGNSTVTISDTAPGSPSSGDLWWKSDEGKLKIYYNDGDSSQWVDTFIPLKGDAGTLQIGTVTTGETGVAASVTNSGTSSNAILNFTLPKGNSGDAATITIGTVTTGSPGSAATVINSGTSSAAVLDITIPRGADGDVTTSQAISYAIALG